MDVKREYEKIEKKKMTDQEFAKQVVKNFEIYHVVTEIARTKRAIRIKNKNIGLIRVVPKSPPVVKNGYRYL